MKKLQKFCTGTVLTLALTLSAFAGDMGTPGATNPTPLLQSSVTGDMSGPGATATGDMQAPGAVEIDPVTEAVLSLLQGLMSLF